MVLLVMGGVVRCGMVWCGVMHVMVWWSGVWCGVVWCGVVWCAEVFLSFQPNHRPAHCCIPHKIPILVTASPNTGESVRTGCGVLKCGLWCGAAWCGVVNGVHEQAKPARPGKTARNQPN